MSERIGIEQWLTAEELHRVRQAIERAEQRTSAEIRVHLDITIVEDVLDHAALVFDRLGMDRTKQRNGVLLYVSIPARRAGVICDVGVNAKVPKGYWKSILRTLLNHFRQGGYAQGLCAAVERLGEELAPLFPPADDDDDELSNQVSIGT